MNARTLSFITIGTDPYADSIFLRVRLYYTIKEVTALR